MTTLEQFGLDSTKRDVKLSKTGKILIGLTGLFLLLTKISCSLVFQAKQTF